MLPDDRTRNLISQIELFSDLEDAELDIIAPKVALREFSKGTVIFHAEDTNKFMYAILRGEVKVSQTTEDGKEAILAFHCSGDSFGEISLIDQLASPASISAVEDSIVAIITRSDFMEMLHSYPKILNRLLRSLTKQLRHAWDQNRILHFRDASNRIRRLFTSLAETRGKTQHGCIELTIRLTHQSIADMTGLTRETVTRVIDKWKREGLLNSNEQRHLVIQEDFFGEKTNM